MHIKEICLEGFKSYATRTVVSGFDPFFNAITGLNGSGKSNILDSICFVLGITNLQQVRATNLQELVYKQGQAGITKATVSIVFDNSDRSRSPLGYEDCPEITVTRQVPQSFHAFGARWSIVVGGRNKYLINGHLAQPSRVQTLFHSVQLNVNNPHFLIMQGRITKVLNMKPPEILSMLEEAAGTRMYEMKKESALKTLDKKQNKVAEIDRLLDQEILPALEKLRKERMQYMQWVNGNAELDRLKRFCIAYEFVQAEKIRDSAFDEVGQVRKEMAEVDKDTEKLKSEIQEMEKKISILNADKEAKLGGDMKALSEKVDILSRSLVKETSAMTNQEESLKTEKKAAEKVMIILILNISSGNDEKCLEDQLRDAKAAVGLAESELKQLNTKIGHSEKELKEKKGQLLAKCDEAAAVENELNVRKKDLEAITSAMGSISYEDGQMEALQKDRSAKLEMIQKLKDEVRVLSGKLANVQFTYRDPIKNFDRSKVKGVVAKLIKVKDASTMTALEVCFYQICITWLTLWLMCLGPHLFAKILMLQRRYSNL
ncbi:hypothetical protein B296_00014290 [Ensete ventricosum]|uniref:RecF/RecN/SMC N-terminal domain-containing protein n=1 Tax=Ensete ventricosum TaxID=4639 RepID=A0A426YUA5_ENSVE|nr:hypothetical protein B296_00014290 [Ensete ventricosum]